jgi:meso-butanediol dehydrogenase / (S,S)-butanediol dehydrogenase / diacetyl reductase
VTPVALVTGGGTGIGAAAARRLAGDGWNVGVMGRRREPVEAVAGEIGGLAVVADTSVAADAERAVSETIDAFGGLDGLVLNAGTGSPGSLVDADPDGFLGVLRVNLLGAFLVGRAAIAHLVERRGALVTVASVAGLVAHERGLAYCSSKAGLIHLTRCIALDHGPAGVRANCVCPGWVRTPLVDDMMNELGALGGGGREEGYALAAQYAPSRRANEPDEVAAVIAWLLSEDASGINGAVLTVDGGATVVDVGAIPLRGVR